MSSAAFSDTAAEMPFIVSTGKKKANSETRKLIRSHVMLGKNLGRKLQRPARAKSKTSTDQEGWELALLRTIPQRVGSDISFVPFADKVDPALASDLLICKS